VIPPACRCEGLVLLGLIPDLHAKRVFSSQDRVELDVQYLEAGLAQGRRSGRNGRLLHGFMPLPFESLEVGSVDLPRGRIQILGLGAFRGLNIEALERLEIPFHQVINQHPGLRARRAGDHIAQGWYFSPAQITLGFLGGSARVETRFTVVGEGFGKAARFAAEMIREMWASS